MIQIMQEVHQQQQQAHCCAVAAGVLYGLQPPVMFGFASVSSSVALTFMPYAAPAACGSCVARGEDTVW
jgi:hypothetical protein